MVWFGNRSVVTTSTVDDYEAGNLNAYDELNDSGAFNAQTGTVHSGTYALEIVAANSGTDRCRASPSGSGLNDHPEEGDTFEFYFNPDSASDSGDDQWVHWSFSDTAASEVLPGDGYDIRFHDEGGNFQIDLVEDGGSNNSDDDNAFAVDFDAWNRIEVVWGASTITAEVFDSTDSSLGTMSISNSSNQNRASFGFTAAANNVGALYIDDVVITTQA